MSRSPVLVISKLGAEKSFFFQEKQFFFQSKYMQLCNIYLFRDSTRFIKIEVKTLKLCLIKVEFLPKNGRFNLANFRTLPYYFFCDQHTLSSCFLSALFELKGIKVSS